jgi:hypothetical protein
MRKKLLIIIAYAAVLATGAVLLLTPSGQTSAGAGKRAAGNTASAAGSLENGGMASSGSSGNGKGTDAGKAGGSAATGAGGSGEGSDTKAGTDDRGADTQGSRAGETKSDAAGSKRNAQNAGDADPANGTETDSDSTSAKKAAGASENSEQTENNDQTSQKQRTVKSADGRYEVAMYAAETDGTAAHDSNVRSGPSSTYERAGSLRTGDVVTIVGEVKELDGTAVSPPWYEVRLDDGTKGFVRSDLLSAALGND